jgi:uncharacterized membrane protein
MTLPDARDRLLSLLAQTGEALEPVLARLLDELGDGGDARSPERLVAAMRHALIGAVTAAVLWELTRHLLVWYFARLAQLTIVYGSLPTAIVVLLTLEILATLLLFGAQVISEYERLERGEFAKPVKPLQT